MRPIDSGALKKAVRKALKDAELKNSETYTLTVKGFMKLIDEQPMFRNGDESNAVKYGEWLFGSVKHTDSMGLCLCSECKWDPGFLRDRRGVVISYDLFKLLAQELKFCPNCGADMRGTLDD